MLLQYREMNAELYLEVACCVGMLVPDRQEVVVEASRWSRESTPNDWEVRIQREAKRMRKQRYQLCIAMHIHILAAWIEGCSLVKN
jgi:hypothetical protein